MSKALHSPDSAQPQPQPATLTSGGQRSLNSLRRTVAMLMVFGLVLIPSLAPLAQRVKESDSPITVTGVGARSTNSGAVVTVSADAPMNRTQTWQEGDKFHLVVPYAAGRSIKNLPRGVKVNRVSNSLEIVVNLKSGSSVTVDPRFNNLNLIVQGGINQTPQNDASDAAPQQPAAQRTQERATNDYAEPQSSRPARERSAPSETAITLPFAPSRSTMASSKSLPQAGVQEQAASSNSSNPAQEQTQQTSAPAAAASPATAQPPANASTQLVPANDDSLAPAGSGAANNSSAPPVEAQSQISQSSPGLFSTIFSTTGVAIIISLCLLALVYLRLRPGSSAKNEGEALAKTPAAEKKDDEEIVALETRAAEPPVVKSEQKPRERRKLLRRMSDKLAAAQPQPASAAAQLPEQALEVRSSTVVASTGPAALFGAYRVDQEVGKLILGQPHRMDVLASRAPDDRRAMETSLLKAMNAVEGDEDGRRRARQALEEYGFLARHSAALLLAHQPCDRAAAARMLGQIGAPAALPFLLEALYDAEMIVRTEVVSSIGALRLPSAIGALLDMARRHPEMPSGPLSQALSACSLDCFDIGGIFEPERPSLFGEAGDFDGEIASLEPSSAYEQLPEFLEDETLSEALERLENTDVEVRAAAARRLAQFQTQTSVAALTALAMRDTEAAVRAAAVASLGEIDHESVFAPVLLAFADEAREVQAAAARALSRLNFNRADAYVRIIETADEEALGNIARACIKARMAAQAIDRLVSEDRRQAYEAFSMLSLLAKSGETGPLLDAITEHSDPNVQMAAIRLLGMTGRPEVAQQFRQLAVRDGLPEKVRTSLLEVVYKIDQALPV
jgi:HEAT repeat protein